MEKLGVDTDGEKTKEASGEPRKTCPRCGKTLLPAADSNVPRCPDCGTEPFEPR